MSSAVAAIATRTTVAFGRIAFHFFYAAHISTTHIEIVSDIVTAPLATIFNRLTSCVMCM